MKTGTLEKIQDGEGKIWYGGGGVLPGLVMKS